MGCSTSRDMGAAPSAAADRTGPFVVPNSADPDKGLGGIRRNPGFPHELKKFAYEDAQTLYGVFERGLRLSRDRPCLGYRPMSEDGTAGAYTWYTYSEVATMRDEFGSGLLHLDYVPANDDGLQLIGVYSKNRVEWTVLEQACNAYKLANVPLYDTLGPDAVRFILNQTGMVTVACSSAETSNLIETKAKQSDLVPCFKNIVQWEDVTPEQREAAEQVGLTIRSLAEIREVGRANHKEHRPPTPDDLATICYTSGTTGDPKGVMTSHGNLVADSSSAIFAGIALTPDDVHISYLPLAHSFERLVMTFVLMCGARAGFFQGNILKITEDIQALRPTLFPSVPRLYNRIYDKIMAKVDAQGGVKATLFHKALNAKKYWLQSNYIKHRLWDGLVFNKVKKNMGLDRVHIMLTGSAPIAPHVMEFLRCVFGAYVLEGYGQTECSAAATVSTMNENSTLGHVGVPLACNEVRLVNVDEMGYLVTDTTHGRVEKDGKVVRSGIPCDGRGEICFRGHNVFKGYYQNEEKTREALDEDGWLHSGDIGLWDTNGNLRIVDRKKNIFKLSQGEYVAAEKVENAYARSPMIAQIFIYGDSYQSVLVAIVVPDEEYVMGPWLQTEAGKPFKGRSFAEIAADKEFNKALMADMEQWAKKAELRGFEKARAVHVDTKPWTPEDLLTPSFKLKRNVAKERYQDAIDAMYASGLGVVAGAANIRQGQAEPAGAAAS